MRTTKTRLLYIDTSAYLSLFLKEEAAPFVQKAMRGLILCSSVLLIAETQRNLVRMMRQGDIKSDQFSQAMSLLETEARRMVLREITLDLCASRLYPAVLTPRSSDLLHLRTAIWFQQNNGLTGFFTFDHKLQSAARELGLPIIETGSIG